MYGFKSMIGVPSNASIPAIVIFPFFSSTFMIRQVVIARGLGRYSARVEKTPVDLLIAYGGIVRKAPLYLSLSTLSLAPVNSIILFSPVFSISIKALPVF